jgi:hypothetical protein
MSEIIAIRHVALFRGSLADKAVIDEMLNGRRLGQTNRRGS